MTYSKKRLKMSDRETLIQIVEELQHKLKVRNLELRRARTRLRATKGRMSKMQDTVQFQRQRILQLYA
ncbi:MAG TPA: hypothetical protein VEB86_13765 [Chryseosolibacter sp.]|nr:hypothetical protein [Chryseosolibacter sp.]